MNEMTVIDTFEIPEDIAQELSKLLLKQQVRERVLLQLSPTDPKFEENEEALLPIIAKIDAFKNKITTEFVPKKYNHQKYSWNYNGHSISGNTVEILTLK